MKDDIPNIPHVDPVMASEVKSDQRYILGLFFKGFANLYFETISQSPFRVK